MPSQAQHLNHQGGFSAVTASITPDGVVIQAPSAETLKNKKLSPNCLPWSCPQYKNWWQSAQEQKNY